MAYDYNYKAALLVVKYAVGVKPGDKVAIMGNMVASDFMKAISI